MTPLLKKLLTMNWFLVAIALGLGVFGIVAIYDAGNNPGWANLPTLPEDISQVWKRQQVWLGLGVIVFFATALVDYRHLRWVVVPAYLVSLGLLLLALLQTDSMAINDTKGWIKIGPISMQPSQAAIASAIMLVAFCFGDLRRLPKIGHWFELPLVRLALAGVILGVPCLLVLAAGDVGSGLVWLPVAISLLLVGRIPYQILLNLVIAIAVALPLVYFFAIQDDESRSARIGDWLKSNRGEQVDTHGSAWATSRVNMAIGSAGWSGKGRRNPDSVHGHGHIPQKTAHTDFIFAVVAEQWGFRGGALLLLGYSFLLFQCLVCALFARDQTGRLLCAGTMGLIFAHVFQNVGMDILLMPITGIPLPLVSYGGTFALIVFFLLGLVQSVWIHKEPAAAAEPARKKRPANVTSGGYRLPA